MTMLPRQENAPLLRFCLVFLLAYFNFFSNAYADEPFVVSYGENYKPFAWKENGEMVGMQIDIINELLVRRLGINVNHTGYPWKRAQFKVEDGMADALFTVASEKRLEYTTKSKEVLIQADVTLFTYRGNPKIKKIKNIKSFSQAKDFTFVDYLGDRLGEKYLKDFNVNFVTDLPTVLKFLANERADLFIQSSPVTNYNIKNNFLEHKIVEIYNPLLSSEFRLLIGFKSKYQSIMPMVDIEAAKMKQDGSMQKIYNKYK